jgi:adenylate cyclase
MAVRNVDDEWRDYLEGTHPDIVFGRRVFSWLPSDPRCRACHSPFHGIGSVLLGPLGYRPWEKNPNVCRRCITKMSRHGVAGAEIELTMLFADVRGSTGLAETISGTEFSALMNRFYQTASAILIGNDALIDKFVGDEVIALFVPLIAGDHHAASAVSAANELLVATGHREPGGPWLPLGIGVHTGVARVGMVGSVGGVLDFTALGDNVNTAARLASNAGAGEIVVSDASATAAHLPPGAGEHRDLQLKGRAEKVGATVIAVDRVQASAAVGA